MDHPENCDHVRMQCRDDEPAHSTVNLQVAFLTSAHDPSQGCFKYYSN